MIQGFVGQCCVLEGIRQPGNGCMAQVTLLTGNEVSRIDAGRVGTIVAGLASVIIGETVFGSRSINRAIIAALLGSIAYRLAIALALGLKLGRFSFTPSDLNLITAILVVAALTLPQVRARFRLK